MKFFSFIIFLIFSLQVSAKASNWNVFVKTYGMEKFAVSIPSDPFLFDCNIKNFKKSALFFKAADKDVKYFMQIVEKSKSDTNVLKNVLTHLKSFSFVKINEYSFSNKNILNILFEDTFLKTLCKIHVIVTKNNIYSFFTNYKEGSEEKHDFFVNSFHLI